MNSVNRGSEWRKWDLHFHTQSSYDYEIPTVSNTEIIDGLIQKQIAVVAITDHHLIDVQRIKNLQSLGAGRVTILPGIEFLSDSKGSEPIHFIGIFSEECDLEHVWEQLKNRTEISRIRGEGRKINEVYCDLFKTAALIRELGGIVTIHAGTKTNSVDNITNSLPHGIAQKSDIAKAIDIFELGKIEDIEPYNKLVNPFLLKTIEKTVPLIICSDNHNIKNFIHKQNLWIKAQPTFEGLKQVVYEPLERVKIQLEEPESKKLDNQTIDQVKFSSSKNTFTAVPIYLNKNLNVIIGGKSSGKSILLYNIARTLLSTKELGKIFEQEKKQDIFNFRNKSKANPIPDLGFNFEVRIKIDDIIQTRLDYVGKSILSEIIYIPQNYLIKLAEPEYYEMDEPLNKIIRRLIIEKPYFKSQYDDIFIKNVQNNDTIRATIIKKYFELDSEIEKVKSELETKGDKVNILKTIEHNTNRIIELKKENGLDQTLIEEYKKYNKDLELLNHDESTLLKDYHEITEFNNKALKVLIDLLKQKDILENLIENDEIKVEFGSKYKKLIEAIKDIRDYNDSLQTDAGSIDIDQYSYAFKVDNLFKSFFENFNNKKVDLDTKLKPYRINEEVERSIKVLEESNKIENSNLEVINDLDNKLKRKEIELIRTGKAIFLLYIKNFKEYPIIIDKLKPRTQALERDGLRITGKVQFNFPKFKDAMLGISHKGSKSYNKWNILKENLTRTDEYQFADFKNDLLEIFDDIVNDRYALLGNTSKEQAIKVLLDDYFYDYWEVLYKGDELGKMSTGKASFVILMIIIGLSESHAPILIDQPEDNLDNRSITEDLVKYLKDKKKERQIILVTHNANIVVNADAENIIVANQKGQNDSDKDSECPFQFDYINGALEDVTPIKKGSKDLLSSISIRKHVTSILEGGETAFKNREAKYGMIHFSNTTKLL